MLTDIDYIIIACFRGFQESIRLDCRSIIDVFYAFYQLTFFQGI